VLLNNFLVQESAVLREALRLIEANNYGLIFTTDSIGTVVGLATDGDIRRKLLEGVSLDEPISICANTEFLWLPPHTPREVILKKLDHRIRVIPILDSNHKLIDIVNRDHLPLKAEEPVYARARSPARISFGGGGSDLTYYFASEGGAVINTAISIYSHAALRLRSDRKIIIDSRDLDETLTADSLELALQQKGNFGLIQALLKAIEPDFGFELYLHSDFPTRSGLGGSAVVSATVLGCFNQFRQDQWDLHELAEIAYQAERFYLGIAGGWQDQYATIFGGFNFMEFNMDENIVHPLRIHSDTLLELEESLVLCDTGLSHDSGDIHLDQQQQMQNESARKQVEENVRLTYRMRNQLLRGKLLEFGQSLDKAWKLKRQFSQKISSMKLDSIYESALQHGAVGGKLLGAGGGGFFIFYVQPFRKHELMINLDKAGFKIKPFRFEAHGMSSWTARESKFNSENKAA